MPPIRLIGIDDEVRRIVDAGSDEFAATYGVSLGRSLALVREVVAQTLDLLDRAPRRPEWGGFLVADTRKKLVVGTCGFTCGPEADGAVEIAYFTFPEFEGLGYASAMARELLQRSVASAEVEKVIAHTLPERNASTRILEKVGLTRIGEDQDPDAGTVWLWAYAPER